MTSVQGLLEHHWRDRARGLVVGAAAAERMAVDVLDPPDPALRHADVLAAQVTLVPRSDARAEAAPRSASPLDDPAPPARFSEVVTMAGVDPAAAAVIAAGAFTLAAPDHGGIERLVHRIAGGGFSDTVVDLAVVHSRLVVSALSCDGYRSMSADDVRSALAGARRRLHDPRDSLAPAAIVIRAAQAFERHADDFDGAVSAAIVDLPDTAARAVAALTGTLVGARTGARCLPAHRLARLPDLDFRLARADEAVARNPLPTLPRRPSPRPGRQL